MMLFCYIQIKPLDQIGFAGELNNLFKTNDYLIFEADNHSDSYLMEQGKVLLSQASEIIFHFDVVENVSLGNLKQLFEALRKTRLKATYQLDGVHPQLVKMLHFIKAERSIDLKDYLNSKASASK